MTDQPATTSWPDDDVILYDGVCVFCSGWIRFVAARDRDRRFRFTAIQSPYGSRLAQAFGIDPGDPDTNAVYNLVAKNRYRIFGRYQACFVPDEGLRARVME
jgi:predicted DCC family thiol-disulfide oxidoreductase YuxK